jgi:hypothetical protein
MSKKNERVQKLIALDNMFTHQKEVKTGLQSLTKNNWMLPVKL